MTNNLCKYWEDDHYKRMIVKRLNANGLSVEDMKKMSRKQFLRIRNMGPTLAEMAENLFYFRFNS